MIVSLALVRRLALASLVANVGIVLTGGAVRLTGSGLGCPTWPRCTDGSWTATSAMGIHGAVEFGNRTLTFLLGAIAVAGLLAAWRLRPRQPVLIRLAVGVLAGIGAQGLIGGVTVWTDLNPWVVSAHFLVSIGIITVAYGFWQRARAATAGVDSSGADSPGAAAGPADPAITSTSGAGRPGTQRLRRLAWLVLAVTLALVAAGTVVTGSGPHAGDPDVPRNGFDPEAVTRVHSLLSYLLLGLAVAAWLIARVTAATAARQAATLLVAVIVGQAVVGLAQYLTGLPESLVWLHLLGSCLVWLAVLQLLHATGTPAAAPGGTASAPATAVREVTPV